ncbi:MAG: hypothetical protein WA615_17200, partial [Bradyrhizobium sp.]|uniref:hypothetical protein n=1 Tax=Bradyrhizobium sp. TaxID=376 RepID=UPI003C7A44ED
LGEREPQIRFGRFSHETDMQTALRNVRCWENSGKHMLALSFSGFDPQRTSAAPTYFTSPAPTVFQVSSLGS